MAALLSAHIAEVDPEADREFCQREYRRSRHSRRYVEPQMQFIHIAHYYGAALLHNAKVIPDIQVGIY